MRRVVLSVSLASMALTSCVAAAAETIKIAYLVPLSGPFANVGETQIRHAQFFLDRINSRGGVLGGRKLEIVPMDNKNSPQEALLLLPQIADRGIRFVSHCCASHVAVALSEAIERHNSRQPDRSMLLLVEVGDWDVTNDKCSFWTFAFYANGEMMLEALTSVAARQPSLKRAYLINQDYVWGHINRRFTREMLARKRPDIAIVGDDLVPLGRVKDFSPYIAKIRAANVDVVFTGNWGPDLVLLIKAAAEARLGASFYTPAGALWGTATAMGNAAVDKLKAQFRWHPNLDIQEQLAAREEFWRRYGQEYYAMPSENEFEMLAAAIEKSGSTDPRHLAYALEGLRIQGTMGEVLMRADSHQLVEPLYVMTLTSVDGGEVKYGLEGTQVGPRTDARIETSELMLPTTCRMRRPARP